MKPRILFLFTLLCTAIASLQTVHAATITVTSTADSGANTLRQALADASDGDTIDATGISGAIILTTGQLVVDKSVTISGPGADMLAVNGNDNGRVFYVGPGKTVTIAGLTIMNGTAGAEQEHGGGVYNDHATLTVTNSTIRDNVGNGGGGIYNAGGDTGSATLTVTNSTISGNIAGGGGDLLKGFGGGIYNDGGTPPDGSATLTVTNSTIKDNLAEFAGGGIFSDGLGGTATLTTVTNSTISGNVALYDGVFGGLGGGIGNGNATLTVTNSTISDNSDDGSDGGGGILSAAVFSGSNATLTVTNSTISDNSGGGIHNFGQLLGVATLAITNSTLSGNLGGGIASGGLDGGSATLTIAGTILNNPSANIVNDPGSIINSQGYNLSSDDASAFLDKTTDQNSTGPLLGPLQDNGGPTLTHELMTGSPAIDMGDPSFTAPPDYDQRGSGFDRVMNGRIDIGAFEVQVSLYAAQVKQPIDADGTSVFNVKRGVVPARFTLTQDGAATCDLPPATIAVTQTDGANTGPIDESVYTGPADNGSFFRIDSCQYIYNLSASALGKGTYQVDIMINGQVVGSGVFQLK